MQSNYRRIGEFVHQLKHKNKGLLTTDLRGVSIFKEFMPSVANVNGTDLSNYRIVENGQFAYNPMHIGRDEVLPIAHFKESDPIIVSPAYVVFEVHSPDELLPEYLMMWCRRSEFDRYAWFTTDSSVRGGYSWEDFCNTELPIPSIDKQLEIVKEYQTIVDRIQLNEQLNQKLEDTAQAIYRHWFVDFEFPMSAEYARSIGKPELEGQPYKSSGGEMEFNDALEQEIPKGWKTETLETFCELITKGTTPETMYSDYAPNLIPYIKGETITEHHGIDESILMYVDEETHQELRRSIIQSNDILFSIAGTLGKFALVNRRIDPANCNQAICIIRLNDALASHSFIMGLFLSQWHKMFYAKNVQQAVQANLSLTTIRALPVIKPGENTMLEASEMAEPLVEILQTYNMQRESLRSLSTLILQRMSRIS